MTKFVPAVLVLLLASAAVAAAWWGLRDLPAHWWRTDVLAECQGQLVTKAEVADGLRDFLWQRKQAWGNLSEEERGAARAHVLEGILQDRLLRLHRLAQKASCSEIEVSHELDLWRRQFQPDGERTLRMGRQQLSDREMEQRVREALADQQWLEEAAESRMAAVTESQLRDWYQKHSQLLRIPHLTHAAHIYLSRHDQTKADRQAEIRKIHRQVMSGEAAFADLCAGFSEDLRSKDRGGDLGWFTAERMPQDFMAAAGSLSVGEISAPVLTALGWHVLLLHEQKLPRIPAFDEVKAEIEAHLSSSARAAAVASVMADISAHYESRVWRADRNALHRVEPAGIH
jgi:hypothetical protein